jgi:Adenylate and Guanylate cyclase catalytic domain
VTSANPDHEEYTIFIYATSEFKQRYKTRTPLIATIAVGSAFCFVVLSMLGYDSIVYHRDRKMKVYFSASEGIVASLFPSNIRHLVFDQSAEQNGDRSCRVSSTTNVGQTSKPVASYYPEATVLYADIAGFTAWSAVRPPEHVFTLLETLYRSFDRVACQFGVYKIETIGDCYVAVTGVPDRQPLHAILMSQFALESMRQMRIVVTKLEGRLGEGTVNLSMRFGLHSGPATSEWWI